MERSSPTESPVTAGGDAQAHGPFRRDRSHRHGQRLLVGHIEREPYIHIGDAHNYGGASAGQAGRPDRRHGSHAGRAGLLAGDSNGAVSLWRRWQLRRGERGKPGGARHCDRGLSWRRGLLADRVQRRGPPLRGGRRHGSPYPVAATKVVGILPSPDGGGYVEAAANGAVYVYGDAVFTVRPVRRSPCRLSVSLDDSRSLGRWVTASSLSRADSSLGWWPPWPCLSGTPVGPSPPSRPLAPVTAAAT